VVSEEGTQQLLEVNLSWETKLVVVEEAPQELTMILIPLNN